MKSHALILCGCLAAAAGCSSGDAPFVDDGGGDGAGSRPPSPFPEGTQDFGAARRAYPIVLVHGFNGFKNIGPVNYYFGVAAALKNDGFDVWTAQLDPFNSSEVRGAELQTFVESVLAQTGAPKVNLICHSQGGLDCRYVASNVGARIGAVVTLSAPHRGDAVADVAIGALPGPLVAAAALFLDLFGGIVSGGIQNQNAQASIQQLTSAGCADFSRRHPDDPQVAYFSIAGRSNGSTGDQDCAAATEAPFVARWDEFVDPLNPLLAAGSLILTNSFSPAPTNDGVVTVASSKWGIFLGCIPADHFDEIGQIAGASPGAGNPFDHLLFYRQLAAWLAARGY